MSLNEHSELHQQVAELWDAVMTFRLFSISHSNTRRLIMTHKDALI